MIPKGVRNMNTSRNISKLCQVSRVFETSEWNVSQIPSENHEIIYIAKLKIILFYSVTAILRVDS